MIVKAGVTADGVSPIFGESRSCEEFAFSKGECIAVCPKNLDSGNYINNLLKALQPAKAINCIDRLF